MKEYITIFLFFFSIKIYSQNLVPNYSFEDTLHCPTNPSQINFVPPWFTPTTGTPDYFNECSVTSGIPNANGGYQYAKTGKAHAGCILFAFSSYREYISTSLSSSLVAGQKYFVSFYVNLSEKSNYAIDAIGCYFSNDSVIRNDYYNITYQPQIANPNSNIISDTANWVLISGKYTAMGGEKYITIGNFKNNANTDSLFLGGLGGAIAYYYIDDICVSTDSMTCNGITGVKEQSISSQITIYPNPSNSTFNIQLPNQQDFALSITDIAERNVYENKNASGNITIDASGFSTGVYFIKVVNQRTVLTGKVIKEQ